MAVLSAILAVGAVLAALSGTVRHEIAVSLTRQPEKYTVLYFSDGLKWAGAGTDRLIMTVSFTVVNHQGRPTRFPYAVQVLDPAKTPIARSEGSVDIADGKDTTAAVDVNVPASAGWSAVEVNLVGRAERIRLLQSSSEATNN
ncbi:hypothetical protein [Mycobacterium sp. 94-17]|uniref:hypothetical protein n=1 Tax=Mycobacterium sp. 94-17 TaxID=2986147 RepID=UPI002D1E6057|nr:hypothetical protein [Mycobacterium sp. 94-17]MEB4210082.1 hypothetical protein [Mycobacterium sp. 94-17]